MRWRYALMVVASAIVFYLLSLICVNTPEQRRICRENAYLTSEIGDREEVLDRLADSLQSLSAREAEIYRNMFNAMPPRHMSEADASQRRDPSVAAAAVSSAISDILAALEDKRAASAIPSVMPIRNFDSSRAGASVGRKFNPFFKTIRIHDGIDLAAEEGTPVIATADGTAVVVEEQVKGYGNRIVLQHECGLQTVYAHLGDISVRKGQAVCRGDVIGRVGSTGRSFAPHLHYEVVRDGLHLDPVHFFFGSLNPSGYRGMLLKTMTVGQSMD